VQKACKTKLTCNQIASIFGRQIGLTGSEDVQPILERILCGVIVIGTE
jgi:hypothetical protein